MVIFVKQTSVCQEGVRMKYFDLKLGFSCNNDCIHCVVADKRDTEDLNTEEVRKIIDSIPKDHVIGFTGGEATIRKDFVELLAYAKQTGHLTSLQTNGAQFEDEGFAKEAAKYLNGVLIAIHSHIEEIHDSIVRVPGMYRKTIAGFANVLRLEIPCTTQTVITKLNLETLPETYDFIQTKKSKIRMNLTFPHPNGNALTNAESIIPKFADAKEQIKQILTKYADLLNTEAIPLCYLYPYQDKVYNFDKRLLNEEYTPGLDASNKDSNYFKDGFTEKYSLCLVKDKRKLSSCHKCQLESKCVGVWKEQLEIHPDDSLEPITF